MSDFGGQFVDMRCNNTHGRAGPSFRPAQGRLPLRWRERLEHFLGWGDWPARAARRLGIHGHLRIRRYRVAVSRPEAAAHPLRIGFAADFHVGPMTDRRLILEACQALREERPDVLLLGGDFADLTARQVPWLLRQLGDVPAPAGCFAVLGNHDYWSDAGRVAEALEEAGIPLLRNRSVRLPPPFDWAWICGLDDHLHGERDPDAALAGADGVRVVLMHSPSSVEDLGGRRVDAALCGHTHGGQIALPGNVPILLPAGPLSRRYARGRFRLDGGGDLIVTTGIGFTGLPVRVFADPEVVLCEIGGADPTR